MTHIALNAHLLSGEAGYRSAGIHGYIYNTLRELPAAAPYDMRFTVLVGAGQPPAHPALTVQRARLPTTHPALRILWEQVVAPLALRRLSPDVLHGMAFALPVAWGGRSVVTIYDLSFIRYPQRLSAARRAYLRTFTRLSARRAHRLIAISESGKREIEALLGVQAGRIHVAPPGVREIFQPVDESIVQNFRIQRGLPPRYILHVGTLEPRKNLDTLLRAYARLPQRHEVQLVLVGGKGWQTEGIFALIDSLDLRDNVVFPGFVPDDELPMWYAAADLFVYPSVYEGFGMPIIEAAAMGTAVIAADTTSLPEAAGPGGVLLPPLKADAWAAAMARLLDDANERRAVAAEVQAHARRYTWAQTAARTVEAYL
jgi:glycosyltransferase involved in cell wall biosynthesis